MNGAEQWLHDLVMSLGADENGRPHVASRFMDGYECDYCNRQWHQDDPTREYAADPNNHADECAYGQMRRYYLAHKEGTSE